MDKLVSQRGNRDGGSVDWVPRSVWRNNKKYILGKRVGYSGGGWRQGANNGARGGARAQIIGASVLLGSAETFNFCKKMRKKCKKRIIRFCGC